MMFRKYSILGILLILSAVLYPWTWPLSNSSSPDTFISAFGPRLLDGSYDFHRGMDLEATIGEWVHAANGGTVELGYQNPGAGHYISIRTGDSNGDHKTYYYHLSPQPNPPYVTDGQTGITEHQHIADSGNSGGVGAHLHLGYGKRVNNAWDKKHPLKEMPYIDYWCCATEMITTGNQDFSFILTVDDYELDIDEFDLFFVYIKDNYQYTYTLTVNYSDELNIPISSNNMGVLDDDWTMYVTPANFSPGNDQEIVFRFVSGSSNTQMISICGNFYTATGSFDGTLEPYQFSPSNSDNFCIPNNQTCLISNHPNPFNPSTTISYNLGENIQTPKIEIYNVKGQKVKSYELEEKAGENSIVWNGENENAKSVSSGIYFYRLINEGKTVQTRKMLMIK